MATVTSRKLWRRRSLVPSSLATRCTYGESIGARVMSNLLRSVGLASVGLAAACSPPEFLVEASALAMTTQQLRVTQDGVAVHTANVALNGSSGVHHADGIYLVHAAPLRAGGQIDLSVHADTGEVAGQAVMPPTPRILSPMARALVSSKSPLEVEWAMEGAADAFEVVVTTESGAKTYGVDGASTSLFIPARELPRDSEIDVTVFAISEGSLVGALSAESRLRIRSDRSPSVTVRRTPLFNVAGADMGPQCENVWLRRESDARGAYSDIEDASITVNGEPIPFANRPDLSRYSGQLLAPVPTGGELKLEIKYGEFTIVGIGTLPEVPVLTAPMSGATLAANAPVRVQSRAPRIHITSRSRPTGRAATTAAPGGPMKWAAGSAPSTSRRETCRPGACSFGSLGRKREPSRVQ
jgi:hypothetical protein